MPATITQMQLVVRAEIPSPSGGRPAHRDNYIFPIEFKGLSEAEDISKLLAACKTLDDVLFVLAPTYDPKWVLAEEQRRADKAAADKAAASTYIPTPEEKKAAWEATQEQLAALEQQDQEQRAELVAAGVLPKADLEKELADLAERERAIAAQKVELSQAIAAKVS